MSVSGLRIAALVVALVIILVLAVALRNRTVSNAAHLGLEGRHLRNLQSTHPSKTEGPKDATKSNATFLYVVGVEGVGHHGVTPAIAAIARSCNIKVDFASDFLRRMHGLHYDVSYRSYLRAYPQRWQGKMSGVLFLEDESFPSGQYRNRTKLETKASRKYDIEWIHNQTCQAGVDVKFLYLTRDFYRTVASHPEFDGGFEAHAQVLYDFTQYIHSEYDAINRKQPGLWAQVQYEWFTELRNCTALVSAVIDFAGWDHCDVDFACEVLRRTLRNSTVRTVNATEYAIAQSLHTILPIPMLDISDNRTYSFSSRASTTSVSNYLNSLVAHPGAAPSGPYHTGHGVHIHTIYPATAVPPRQERSGVPERLRYGRIGDRQRGWR